MKCFVKIVGLCILLFSFTYVSIDADETNENIMNINEYERLDHYADDLLRSAGGRWYKTVLSNSTGVVRLVLGGNVYYDGFTPISASPAFVSDFYDGTHGGVRIEKQSHVITTRGVNYNITIGFYLRGSGVDSILDYSKNYSFTVNPGPK